MTLIVLSAACVLFELCAVLFFGGQPVFLVVCLAGFLTTLAIERRT